MSKDSELLKEVRRLRSVVRERDQMESAYRIALSDLVRACEHVAPLSMQLPMHTIKEMRLAMKFMAACDAAKVLLEDEA